jgi:hypothetical protein
LDAPWNLSPASIQPPTGEPAEQGLTLLQVFRREIGRGPVEHVKQLLLTLACPLSFKDLTDDSGFVLAAAGPTLEPGIGVARDPNADLAIFGCEWHAGAPPDLQEDTGLKVRRQALNDHATDRNQVM